MAEAIILNTPDELVNFLRTAHFKKELLAQVQLGDAFNLHFKICGSQWSGLLDYRVGRFIYEVQRDIFLLYQEVTGEKISYRNRHDTIEKILVIATVKDDSLEFLLGMKDAIQEMVKKMTGEQIVFGAIIALVLWCGKGAYISWTERQTKADEIAAQLQINQGREETVRQAIEILGRSSEASANLVGRMDKEDTFSFRDHSGTSRTLEAREIKANLPERTTADLEDRMTSQPFGRPVGPSVPLGPPGRPGCQPKPGAGCRFRSEARPLRRWLVPPLKPA